MSSSVIITVLRYLMTYGGGILVARGIGTESMMTIVTGIVIGAVNGYIGAASSTHDAKINAAVKLPEVATVIMQGGDAVKDTPNGVARFPRPMSDNG